eukprot:scaffold121957_cov28-Tisochrysis_lutea.AAC.3
MRTSRTHGGPAAHGKGWGCRSKEGLWGRASGSASGHAERTCIRCIANSMSSNCKRDGMGSAEAGGTGGSWAATPFMVHETRSIASKGGEPRAACATKRRTSCVIRANASGSAPWLTRSSRPDGSRACASFDSTTSTSLRSSLSASALEAHARPSRSVSAAIPCGRPRSAAVSASAASSAFQSTSTARLRHGLPNGCESRPSSAPTCSARTICNALASWRESWRSARSEASVSDDSVPPSVGAARTATRFCNAPELATSC